MCEAALKGIRESPGIFVANCGCLCEEAMARVLEEKDTVAEEAAYSKRFKYGRP